MSAEFHYNNQPLPTISQIKQQKSQLLQMEKQQIATQDVFPLIKQRTQFCDDLLCHLWQHFSLDQQAGLALFAVGGYGRKEMFPHSDLDCLILLKQPADEALNKKLQQFIQDLWDAGFKVGQAVRTFAECETLGRTEITIATNLLEHRFLCGDRTLIQALTHLLAQADFWPAPDFYQAKIGEQKARYQRFNNTNYNVEPDLKYSPGGLRDLHLLYWIALRAGGGKNLEEIYQSGWICQAEYDCLKQSQACLFKLRFALHLNLKRDDNRLLFERQRLVSETLNYEQEGNAGVEMMMKVFFRASQNIQVLSQILLQHYANNELVPTNRKHLAIKATPLDQHFAYDDHFIFSLDPQLFKQDPVQILQLFYYLTCYPKHKIHPDCLRQLYLSVQAMSGCLAHNPRARELFLHILAQPRAIQLALQPMHQYGVLSIYLPNWKEIEGLMQFDLFHIYTVDEHILRVLQNLEDFLQQTKTEKFPLCSQVIAQIPEPSLLYISALFHDIGKGKGGDHSQIGGQLIRSFAILHGFDKREIETMVWLVENHLLFSMTAQRRDIQDPEIIQEFAQKMQNLVRLDYLLCLTVADIYATNEKLWNSWKFSLFNSLYQNSKKQLAQGIQYLRDNQVTIEENQAQSIKMLQQHHLTPLEIQQLWKNLPEDYFLRNHPTQITNWTLWLKENKPSFSENQLIIKVSNRFCNGGTALFIYAKDQAQLFYYIASTLEAKKFSIHDAQIQTLPTGYVFDNFIITELDGSPVGFERRRALETSLHQVLQGEKKVQHRLHQSHKLKAFQVKTQVRFLNTMKPHHTEMEVFALDKVGLLAEMGEIFYQCHLNLHQAKISTIGEKVEDFFVLTNSENKALTVEEREQLKAKLLANL